MRPVRPPCSTEALKTRYANLGGLLVRSGMADRTGTHPIAASSAFGARGLRVHNDSTMQEGGVMIVGYDHVQVAIPSGAEAVARDYYGGLLGMVELPKPAKLAAPEFVKVDEASRC